MSHRQQDTKKTGKNEEEEELTNEFNEKAALHETGANDDYEVLDEKAAMRQGDELDALLTDTPPASRPDSRGAGEGGDQNQKEELQHIFDQFDGDKPNDSSPSIDEQNTAAKDDSNSTVSGNNTNNDNANSTSTDASKNNTSSATTTTINNNDESVSSSAAASSSSSSEESNKRTSLAEIKRSADERKGREREEIPFDFHKFLEQMHRRSATPIVKYFKSFLHAFDRRPYAVHEQVKIIQDFLEFIYVKMRECEVWRNASEQEFENAKEGMEKLVMNRLYNVTFSPSTTDDKERDEILHQKISIFRWIREEHLDIPKSSENESFIKFAISELLKINNYKAPRDKLICILNCCKVIFGLIKHVEGDGGADKFLPILIYVVIKANPPRLISNVQYISRFRSPEHLQSESGYYLTNLMGSITFIETMDAASLSITKEEFDANIERTMNELEQERPSVTQDKQKINYDNAIHPYRSPNAQPQPLIDPVRAAALLEKGSTFAQKTMQKPLNFVGKIFQGLNEGSPSSSDDEGSSSHQQQRLYPHDDPRYQQQHQQQYYYAAPTIPAGGEQRSQRPLPPHPPPAPDPRAVEAQRVFEANLQSIVSMFSNVDPEVCFMVFQAKGGDVSQTVDALLEIADPEAIPSTGVAEEPTVQDNNVITSPPRPPPKTPAASGDNERDAAREENDLIRF